MSEKQLKAFVAKIQTDSSLLAQLKAEGADPVAIAKAAGFSITQADLDAATPELSDEELDAVSGGVALFPWSTIQPGQYPNLTL